MRKKTCTKLIHYNYIGNNNKSAIIKAVNTRQVIMEHNNHLLTLSIERLQWHCLVNHGTKKRVKVNIKSTRSDSNTQHHTQETSHTNTLLNNQSVKRKKCGNIFCFHVWLMWTWIFMFVLYNEVNLWLCVSLELSQTLICFLVCSLV